MASPSYLNSLCVRRAPQAAIPDAATKEPSMSSPLITSDPEILGGTPVFAGTRVPVRLLFENLADGASLAEILEAFPTLQREQAIEVLRQADSLIASRPRLASTISRARLRSTKLTGRSTCRLHGHGSTRIP